MLITQQEYDELKARIAELEKELDAERKRRGTLQFQHDYLQRGCADDALTIHTCEEIIDRTKKELGTYRELYFDNIKRIAELEAALRFYANKDDYIYSLDSVVWDDNGEVARKALGEVK